MKNELRILAVVLCTILLVAHPTAIHAGFFEDVGNFVDDVSDKAKKIKDDVTDTVDSVKNKVNDTVDKVKDSVDTVKDTVGNLMEKNDNGDESPGSIDYKYIQNAKFDLKSEGPKNDTIRSPLSAVPSIVKANSTLRVELDPSNGVSKPIQAWLTPSFGNARPNTTLKLESVTEEQSSIWHDKRVLVAKFTVPQLGQNFTDDLYDLHVRWSDPNDKTHHDFQPRAVSVVSEFEDNPKIMILADPQTGDPRALVGALKDSWDKKSLNPLTTKWEEVIGDASKGGRWGAFQKTIQEINLVDPEFVLFAGDLTFGLSYKNEYEDAYRLLNQIQAPTFLSPGNHDGYKHLFGPDGLKDRYEKYFGPTYYSRNYGDKTHVVSINTYDWSSKKRSALRLINAVWGGQVRGEQRRWLERDWRQFRTSHPGGQIISFSHHDPTWEQTRTALESLNPLDDGIKKPADQKWSGDNRFELISLMNEYEVDAHFAGHVHSDRVARTVNGADVVEAKHRLRYRTRDGAVNPGTWNNQRKKMKEALFSPHRGTLFVETTTTSSGTSLYWGWRPVWLDDDNGGLEPSDFGYPATENFLDKHAENPDAWNASLSELGLFSYPSYMLNPEQTRAGSGTAKYKIKNDLSVDISGQVLQTLSKCGDVSVENGSVVWTRQDRGHQDVKIKHSVNSNQTKQIKTQLEGGGTRCQQIRDILPRPANKSQRVHPRWQ